MKIKAEAYAIPNLPGPGRPVILNPDICDGCNLCVNICIMDIFIPNPSKGKPPIVLFPEECYYDGICVQTCPQPEAIRLNHPLMNRVRWKKKESNEHFRT